MPDLRVTAIIVAGMAAVAISIYIINNQTDNINSYEQTPLLKGIEISDDEYLKAKITVNGFELTADIAVTDEQRRKGLSVKDDLNENEGMLFVFKQEGKPGFWMSGMKFPIDVIWIGANGKVVHVENNLQPCTSVIDCPTYTPEENSLYVLETVAGFAQIHNVYVGTEIGFQIIR